MKKAILYSAMYAILLTGILVCSCNKEPEDIAIQAIIPENVFLSDTFSAVDTFKFTIVTEFATIDTIKLYEENSLYVRLAKGTHFPDALYKYNFNLLYNPNSAGIKNFELKVIAGSYRKTYPFSVTVVE